MLHHRINLNLPVYMEDKTNVAAETTQVQQVTSEVEVNTYRETIKQLIANGAKRINNLRVKNVTFTDKESWVRLCITVSPSVKGYNTNGEEVDTNNVFVSLFALVACIRENEEFAWANNHLIEHPNVLPLILCGARINVLQRHYEAGTEIYNPFSKNPNQVPSVYEHNLYINDVIDIELSQTGARMLDKLADKIMGF